MKHLLYTLLAMLALVSCSKEEEVVAPPAPNKYTLTISAETGGTVSTEGGLYNEGSKITVTATPDGMYLFKEWSDGSTQNPREITVTSNLTLKASFIKKTYPLAVTVEGEGTVAEEVIVQGSTTETEYNAGTTVRLTATPNEGWVFAGWSGDIESEELVIEVPIEKGTSVSALFKRDSFELNITIEGEGTVKEEVIVQPGQYDYETVVRLTAIPSEGYAFSGWSGDVTSEENPIELEITDIANIQVLFEYICNPIQPLNYSLPSYETFKIIHPKNIQQVNSNVYEYLHKYGTEKISLDYNKDGYLDFISFENDYDNENSRQLIKFYLGDCEGNLTLDELNSGKFLSLDHSRKIILGDYNNDTYPDVFLIGHGWDYPPFAGEYPVILFSSATGEFTEKRLEQFSDYFHGGSSGDFDNDGDLDVILTTLGQYRYAFLYLENDGNGNFIENENLGDFLSPHEFKFLNSEMLDINKDGFLDVLFMSGQEGSELIFNGTREVYFSSLILLGNGSDFTGERINLPLFEEGEWYDPDASEKWYEVYDADFFDLNDDGNDEIIFNRHRRTNEGWYIQILEKEGEKYVDRTDKFIDINKSETGFWNVWLEIRDFDNDGIVELRNSIPEGLFDEDDKWNYHEWELINGKLIKSK